LDRGLAGVVACVGEVELSAIEVVGHRALRFAVAKRGPCFSLSRVTGAVDAGELCRVGVGGEPVEHAARADRRQLLAVAHGDQLRSRALDKLGDRVKALVVGHPRLVQEDRRVGAETHGVRVCSCDERVEG
jgi:hypothetical protein